jgi:hypothetical protein
MNSTYIVAYTLKHNETPNTFVDYWHRFADDTEENNKRYALEFYTKLLDNDGGTDGYELYTISLSKELVSSEDEGSAEREYPIKLEEI